jgi:DNA-directed RNA polymerase subunit H (RpoH/RPB5)
VPHNENDNSLFSTFPFSKTTAMTDRRGTVLRETNKLIFSAKRTQLEMLRDRGYEISDLEKPLLAETAGVMTLKRVYGNNLEKLTQTYVNGNKRTVVWYADDINTMYREAVTGENIEKHNSGSVLAAFCAYHETVREQIISQNENRNGAPPIEFACIIIICASAPQSQFVTKLEELANGESAACRIEPPIQLFVIHNLLFNPTKHAYVPKHVLLTDAQRAEFYKRTNLKDPKHSHHKNLLPLLKVCNIFPRDNKKKDDPGDPIAKYYFAKPGDIFEITRVNIHSDTQLATEIIYRYVV